MTEIRTETTRPPGRPRSARAEKAIVEATLDLLAEEAGVAGVSIEAVAARAGVGKTTIYRRWPNKEALIVDALATLKLPMPEPAGESVRDDLLALARTIGAEQHDRHTQAYWNVMGAAAKYPELMRRFHLEVLVPRREIIRGVLRRGVRTGELRADTDIEVVLSMLIGSMTAHSRAKSAPAPPPPNLADVVVDTLLRGISA